MRPKLLKLLLCSRFTLGVVQVTGCSTTAPVSDGAQVDAQYTGAAGAEIHGQKTYRTIQSALDAAPDNRKVPYVIAIRNGVYKEKITVTKPNITFLGESRDRTILSWDDYSGVKGTDGKSIGTWKCATLIIQAPDFRAENLTVENTFDFLGNDTKDSKDPSKTGEPQGVALMTDKGADRTFFYNVSLLGYQDTLFTASGRSYFLKSLIAGNVDFIFGAGQVIINDSDIVTRPRGKDMAGSSVGYVTAPSTQIADKYGIVILNSRLKKENDKVPARSSPLGRPWHPTSTFPDGRYADPNAIGMATFINCWMDDHITVEGWDKMSGTGRQAGEKDWFLPDNPLHARFSEYGSTGPGAVSNPKRKQLSASESLDYAVEKVLSGWKPEAR